MTQPEVGTAVSYPIVLPPVDIIHRIDPLNIVDFKTQFLNIDESRRAGDSIDLLDNSQGDEAGRAAFELLRPVKQALHAYLGLTAASKLVYQELDFQVAKADPGKSYAQTAERWHSDGDHKDLYAVRVDASNSTEALIGELPQAMLQDIIGTDHPVTSLTVNQLQKVADTLENSDTDYDDEYLFGHGLTSQQAIPGGAYLLSAINIHRSPRNVLEMAGWRSSFSILFRAAAADS